ncbi:hypothetical protein CLOM_g13347 [Closterium sp. NIES-68]|nr:hypothetical protein CLOM_g22505 [Closterium sp. NIES-68]GJP31565.1 hypothetical protein CLOM_g13347 [Closterium sp. NIES-68]GJP59467.1 hypothetical protein CLOP_g12260 [Closterium sp. NIES-67]
MAATLLSLTPLAPRVSCPTRRAASSSPQFTAADKLQCLPRRVTSVTVVTQRRAFAVRASTDETGSSETSQAEASPKTPPAAQPASPPPQQGLLKGQVTAIVTGAISLILAIGYLALVQLLDSRGLQMLPPPPEAFGP